jgi:hypothetical protein
MAKVKMVHRLINAASQQAYAPMKAMRLLMQDFTPLANDLTRMSWSISTD